MQRTSRGFLGSLLVASGGVAMALGSASATVVVGAVMSLGGAVVTYRVLRAPNVFHSPEPLHRGRHGRRRKRLEKKREAE